MNYKELPVSEIALGCQQENQRFLDNLEHNAQYCFELFRRAIVLSSEDAWHAVYDCFEGQVHRWVTAHPSFNYCQEDVDYFVNVSFAKFWQAVTPEKFPRFSTLGHLLQYLKTCVAGAIIDHVRQLEKQKFFELETSNIQPEDFVSRQMSQEAVWQWVQSELNNDRETLVIRQKFLFDMTPRDIYASYPDFFPKGINEIYRILENILRRLHRNAPSRDRLS